MIYGLVKVIDAKNLELHNSLEAPKEKKFTVGEFEVEKKKNRDRKILHIFYFW